MTSPGNNFDYFNRYEDFASDSRNIIISIDILNSIINILGCRNCGGSVQISLQNNDGIVSSLEVSCSGCSSKNSFWSSDLCDKTNIFETNLRLFYGLRCIGKGLEAGKLLCAMLNLPPPSTARSRYTKVLSKGLKAVAEDSMINATKEAIVENDNNPDISVAFDGSWQKRGYK